MDSNLIPVGKSLDWTNIYEELQKLQELQVEILIFDGSPSDAFEGVVINNNGFRCGDYMEKACDYIKDNMK